ncbi:MAG: cardiolipin synthase ClsB [Gammaproteobacteria bacterium]|nr:cardiolipin synthase ClsB [Gammaproteobacteria bacterium]
MSPDYVAGNRLTLLRSGEQYFPALIAALDAAQREVFVETYIFADDVTGGLVAAALARAAVRGVQVHLLLDGFGARAFANHLRAMLEAAGAEVLVFRPKVSPWTMRRSRLRRMHRKIVCIDAAVAFVGGINVIDDQDTPGQLPPRYDYAVRIEGPLVTHARRAAARLWSTTTWASVGRRWPGFVELARRRLPRAPPDNVPLAGKCRAALVLRDTLRHRRDIEEAYLACIEAAQTEVVIANAYFFPGWRFRRALQAAAGRGVRVVLLLQSRVEYTLLHYASRALYRSLLEAGVEIHEYHRGFLHAKVAVFDSQVATVGSSNIDPFSFLMAKEANLFVADAGFAAELRASLGEALEHGARQVRIYRWRRLSWWLAIRIKLAYAAARLVMAIAGYGKG